MTLLRLSLSLWLLTTSLLWADEDRTISVTGVATVETAPDMATLTIDVTHEAQDAATALAATSEATAAVIARLTAEGVAPQDMQTQGLSLQPLWSNTRDGNTRREITGFMARNGVSARILDLSNLGRILDVAVQDGANGFGGLRFGLQDPAPLQSQARKAAVAEAMARAADLAEAAGVGLGPVQSISQSGASPRPMQMEMSDARASASVPIAAGEVGVRAQVSMVFAIQE